MRFNHARLNLVILLILSVFFIGEAVVVGQTCDDNPDAWYYYNALGSDGDIDNALLWCVDAPSAGVINRTWYIYGDLTRTGDVSITQGGYLYGSLDITGSIQANAYSTNLIGASITTSVDLTGSSLIMDAQSQITVGGAMEFSYLEAYGTVTVTGNYTNNNGGGLIVRDGAHVEIFGSLSGPGAILVEEGGVLIVHGNITTSNSGNTINGTLVVAGDASITNILVGVNGNIAVIGDLYVNDGSGATVNGDIYVLDPLSTIDFGTLGLTIGDENDLISDESTNSDLLDALTELNYYSVQPPTKFTYSGLSGSATTLFWTKNGADDDVIIAHGLSGIPISLNDGTTYSVGDMIGTDTVVYKGSASTIPYAALTPDVNNYLTIWSDNGSNSYSYGVRLTVEYLSDAVLFYDDFEDGNSESWVISGNGANNWIFGTDVSYKGQGSVYISNDGTTAGYGHTNQSTRDLTKTIAIPTDYKSVELRFYWKCVGEVDQDEGAVVGLLSGLSAQAKWKEEVVDVTDYIGGNLDLDFYWHNDNKNGADPGFCVDEVMIVGSEVARPQSISGEYISSTQIDLTWEKSIDNNDVIIAYSTTGSVGRPESGTSYSVGDYFSGGGRVVYIGDATSYTHNATFNDNVTYGIWSINGSTYSSGINTEVILPVSLPYTQDFEGSISEFTFINGYDNEWVLGKATYNSASKSVYISNDLGITAGYDDAGEATVYLDFSVDLRGFETASMTFYWMADGDVDDAYGDLLINGSSLGTRYYGTTSWSGAPATVDLTTYVGDVQNIQFKWYNKKNGKGTSPGFCIDDIAITGTIAAPESFSATNSNDIFNDLAWALNAYDDEVIIAYSDGAIGDLEEGVNYEVGDELSGGGTILYIGSETSFTHEPLNYNTIYYYKIWSSRNTIYSTALESSAKTPAKAIILQENWDGTTSGHIWTPSAGTNNYWVAGGSDIAYAAGNYSFITYKYYKTGEVYYGDGVSEAYLDVVINIDELYSGNLIFDWISNGDGVNDYGEVYLNGTKISADKEYNGSSTWQTEIINIDAYCGVGLGDITLRFQWNNDNSNQYNPPFCIDNVEVSGIFDPTSVLDNGVQLNTTISSIANSSGAAVDVLSFDLTDKLSQYNDTTRVQQLVISKGTNNTIENWSDAIAGAILEGPDLPAGLSGVVTSSAITFTGTDMILLQTEDAAETYTLKVWLQTGLNDAGIYDGDEFDFAVSSNGIVTGLGDDFIKNQLVSSGSVAIDVVATKLIFSQQPPEHGTQGELLSTTVEVAGADVNGNMSTDYSGTVTLSNTASLAMTGNSESTVGGIATFSSLIFTETGTTALTASDGVFSSGNSSNITIDNFCIPTHNSTDRFITNVIVGAINNTSGDDGGYEAYLDQQTSFVKDETYDVTLGVYANNNKTTGYAYVWVDWDISGDFDATERTYLGSFKGSGSDIIASTITIPTTATSGAARMRVQFTDGNTPADACTAYNGEAEDYIVNISANEWLGNSTDWNTTSNWYLNVVPDASSDVFIPAAPTYGSYPTMSGSVALNDLSIETGATVTINEGSRVTINGDLTGVDDGLYLKNSNASPSSLIVYGSASPTVNVDWYYDVAAQWWYIGHCASGFTNDAYNTSLASPNDYKLYERTTAYAKIEKASTYNFDVPMQGFALMIKDPNSTVSYSGLLNLGNYTYTIGDFNDFLIANPYSSYIDITSAGVVFGEADNTIYTRTTIDGGIRGFATYNVLLNDSANGGSKYIAPGQSFWVAVSNDITDGSVFAINSTARTHGNGAALKSQSSLPIEKIRMTLQSDYSSDEIVLAFTDLYGSTELTEVDSKKKFVSGGYANLYTKKGSGEAVIAVWPALNGSEEIPLAYRVESNGLSEFTFSFKGIEEFNSAFDPYLYDYELGIVINLREVNSYSFIPGTTKSEDRFAILFEPAENVGLATDVESQVEGVDWVMVREENNSVIVEIKTQFPNQIDAFINVYSMNGTKVKSLSTDQSVTSFSVAQNGELYLVEVELNGKTYVEKIILK